MQLGESAGHAAALAVKGKTTPGKLDPDALIRKLATSRVMISFFNDVDVTSDDPQVAAAQYFGTKGFFAGYDAKLDAPLTEAVKAVWLKQFDHPQGRAAAVRIAEAQESPATNESRGEALLRLWGSL